MKISRNDLIKKCDEFLNGKINEKSFEIYSDKIIVGEDTEWENDDVIAEIIYQWNSPDMQYPITKKNIELWKHQLKTYDKRSTVTHIHKNGIRLILNRLRFLLPLRRS